MQKNKNIPLVPPPCFRKPSSLIGPCLWRFLQSAPPQISARGRTDDLAAILSVIHDARKFVFISVMDFLPMSQYSEPAR